MRESVNVIVGLTVGGLVASYLIPLVVDELVNVDTAAWSSGAAEMWGILDLIIVLVIMLTFLGFAINRAGKV